MRTNKYGNPYEVGIFSEDKNRAGDMFSKLISENKGNIDQVIWRDIDVYNADLYMRLSDNSTIRWINPVFKNKNQAVDRAYIDSNLIEDRAVVKLIKSYTSGCEAEDIIVF